MSEKCDEEIYKNGAGVAVLSGPSGVIEAIVKTASSRCGEKMDWYYVGGRALVKTLGDAQKAAKAIHSCMPESLQ